MKRNPSLLLAALFILLPSLSWGTLVKFVQTSATTWEVQYEGFVNVGGVLFSVRFDPDTATAGGARKGGSVPATSQYAVGTPSAGELRIAIAGLTPFPKSGTLATVTLTPKGGSEPRLLEISAQLSTADAKRLPNAAVGVFKASFPPSDTSTTPPGGTGGNTGTTTGSAGGTGSGTGTGTGTTTGSVGGGGSGTGIDSGSGSTGGGGSPPGLTPVEGESGGVGGSWRSTSYVETLKAQRTDRVTGGTSVGSVTIVDGSISPGEKGAGESGEKGEKIQAVRRSVGEDRPADGEGGEKKEGEKKKESRSVRYAGILDRFREFSGTPSRDEFIGLFADPVASDITQTPVIAWLDDTEKVTIRVKESLLVTPEPSFVLKGAALVDLRKEEGEWVLTAHPRVKGTAEPKLIIMDGGERTIEYPLVIVPKITLPQDGKTKRIDPAAFDRLISDMKAPKPQFDFNGDARHTPEDDYIFTANFIVQTKTTPVKPKKPAAPAAKEQEGKGRSDQKGTEKPGVSPAPPAKKGGEEGVLPAATSSPPRFTPISSSRQGEGKTPPVKGKNRKKR